MKHSKLLIAACITIVVIAMMIPTLGATSSTQAACSTRPLMAKVELGNNYAQVRTTFTLGCSQVAQAITTPGAKVSYGPHLFNGVTRNTLSMTPSAEPTTDSGLTAASTSMDLSASQVDDFIKGYLSGHAGFTPLLSASFVVQLGSQVDTSAPFIKQLSAIQQTSAVQTMSTTRSPGTLYTWGCGTDSNYGYQYGCYRGYGGYTSTATYRFLMFETQSTGHGTNVWKMTKMGMETDLGSYASIIQWDPSSDITVGKCTSESIGLTFQGVGISRTSTICPSKLHPTISEHKFVSAWQGGSTATVEGEGGATTVAIKKPYGSGARFYLVNSYCWHGGGFGC